MILTPKFNHQHPAILAVVLFVSGETLRFQDCTDGLSNTLFMAEVVTYNESRRAISSIAANVAGIVDNPSLCLQTVDRKEDAATRFYQPGVTLRLTPDGKGSRGGNWADSAISWSGFNTILPPNSPSCDTASEHLLEGVFSAASLHQGGCHVLFGNGAVKFITDSIDTGNLRHPSLHPGNLDESGKKSPYGIWGALGTIAGEESLIENP